MIDRTRLRRISTETTYCLVLAGFVWLGIILDVFAGRSSLLTPLPALILFFSLPLWAIARASRRRWMIWANSICLLMLLILIATPWHPRKRFVRDLESIAVGATVNEVETIMGSYLKGRGAKWLQTQAPSYPEGTRRTAATGTMTYRWNDSDGRYDSDWGLVTFENGRVKRTEFAPD